MPFGLFGKRSASDLNNQGIAQWKKCKFDDAIREFDKSIEIDPQYALAWCNKGGVLNDLHKYDEALSAIDKAIEIDAQLAVAWASKGKALQNQGKYDEALKAVDRALEIDPKLAAAQDFKREIQEKLRNFEDETIDKKPKESNVLNSIEPIAANPAQKEGLGDRQPNNIDNNVLLTAQGTKEKVELLEQVIRIHESSKSGADTVKEVSIKEIKNVTLKKKGFTDGNITLDFPGSGPLGLKLINFKDDHKQEFEQLARELMCRINPDKPEYGWNNKGSALEKQGKLDEAIQAFDKAIELNPNYALPWSNKALMLLRQEKYDEALKAVDRALEIDPKLAAAQNVKKLITKKPDTVNKNISKILQRRGIPSNEVLIATEGANGQICLTEKGVLIGREGGLGTKMLVGYTKGEKFLPYRNITSVQFKEPGMTWGYIQFTVPGGIENRGGAFDAGSDENTVTFRADKLEIFRKIRDIVEERQGLGTVPMPQVPTPQMPPKSSIADELTKLAALKRDGAITEEEFDQLKKDLLGSRGK